MTALSAGDCGVEVMTGGDCDVADIMGGPHSSSMTPTVNAEQLSCNAKSMYNTNVQLGSHNGINKLSGSDRNIQQRTIPDKEQ